MPRLWSVAVLTMLLLLCGGALRAGAAPPPPGAAAPAGRALPSGAPGCWTLVPGAFLPGSNSSTLYSVAALAPDNVWAVGTQYFQGTFPVVEHWDGQQWTEIQRPNNGRLFAVAGAAPNDVWAAGHEVIHWDGSAWTQWAYPGGGVTGLVAITPNDVWAVGDGIAHWDGQNWFLVPHPGQFKSAVAAVSTDDVWAVGADVEHWDGTTWSIVPSPNPDALVGVAAVAANDVWAVGTVHGTPDQPYIQHWDGTAWSAVQSPNPGPDSRLFGVAAVAANDVWAVGEYYGYSNQQTLTEHWDGTVWTVVPSPNDSYRDNHLYAVAASGPGDIWAVGQHTDSYYYYAEQSVEHYVTPCPLSPPICDTGWDIVHSPSTQDGANYLRAVGIVSTSDVWAVGEHGGQTLIEHWDGTQWLYRSSPNVGNLNALVVRAANDIWAAGEGILHWDGTQWNAVAAPPGTIYGLTVLATNDAWAVGQAAGGPFTEHWNGSIWTVVPNPSAYTLYGVSGAATNDVWAVGGLPQGYGTAVLLHWDDVTWSTATLPTPAPDELRGVTALAANDVWAVGHRHGSGAGLYSMHWNGTAWSSVPFADPGGTYYLSTVSGSGPNDVWAVGTDIYATQSRPLALAVHWDGAAWNQMWLPWPAYNDEAFGVAALAPNDAWAVGHFDGRTLTWHYSGPCPVPTSTPTASATATPPTPLPTATATLSPTPSPVCPLRWQVLPYNDYTHSLAAVGVVAPDDVWAVGSVIAHWNGVQWNTLSRPANWLWGLAVINAHDIWAVGDAPNAAQHWNGHDWQNYPNLGVHLYAVAALATNNVWAVGGPTIAHYDGTNWTVLTNLAQGTLSALAAVAPNDVWAVGEDGSGGTLAEHWNGTAWSRVLMPPLVGPGSLGAVAFAAPNDGWAVGRYHNPTINNDQAIIEHWDGTAWTIVPSPNAGSYSTLEGLTILAPNDIWAVGAANPILVEHWDGTCWSLVPNPPVPYNNGRLTAVAAVTAGELWAVGWTWSGYDRQILVERYGGDCSLGTSTPSPTRSPTPTGTATATRSPTPTGPATATRSPTPINTGTAGTTTTPLITGTPTVQLPSPTVTLCALTFSDVPPNSPFYAYIRCLACRGILSGYTTSPPCAPGGTPCFNGGATVTRGQVAKIVANAAGYAELIPSARQTFTDVPYTNPFWLYIERAVLHTVISGYSTSPPCSAGQVPCFLPFNNVTRGQMAKIDSNAGGYAEAIPSTQQTFSDVPYTNPFWVYIERAALHGVISGYSTSPPCPGGVPCFLWANNLTRNQAAKVVAMTFYPSGQTPARRTAER